MYSSWASLTLPFQYPSTTSVGPWVACFVKVVFSTIGKLGGSFGVAVSAEPLQAASAWALAAPPSSPFFSPPPHAATSSNIETSSASSAIRFIPSLPGSPRRECKADQPPAATASIPESASAACAAARRANGTRYGEQLT